ncbi:MAG: glycosyltransferase family 2 protein [Pseudomonadota bacterium]
MAGFEEPMATGALASIDVRAVAKVSVVVVSYETGPLLLRSVASALAQPETAEVVLVDNGNPPALIEQARLLGHSLKPVRVLTGHGNVGFAAACNIGARAATGPDLLFLNPDAVLPEGALSTFRAAASSADRSALVGGRVLGPDGNEQAGSRRRALTPGSALIEASGAWKLSPSRLKQRCFNAHTDPCPVETTSVHTISGACMFVSRDSYLAIGGMDERYFLHVEDIDFCLRFRQAGGVVLFEPDVALTHFKSSSRCGAMRVEALKSRSMTTYFWRHFADKSVRTTLALGLVTAAIWGVFALRAAKTGATRLRAFAGFARRTRGAGVRRAARFLAQRSAR